jgi:hypothetical protein
MIQSIGWIIYQIIDNEPKFFIMKRRAMSWKIEWIAPKGKIEPNEKPEFTCVREISEETGMDINLLHIKSKLSGGVELKNMNFGKGTTDKSINYFLVEYKGDPLDVKVIDQEWFTGMVKRSSLPDIMNLVPYKDLRAVFREGYDYVCKQKERQRVLDKIDLK